MAESAEREASFRAAVMHPAYSHSRYKPYFGGMVYAYHYAPKSPSGFLLADQIGAEAGERIVRECQRTSALSPTEPR